MELMARLELEFRAALREALWQREQRARQALLDPLQDWVRNLLARPVPPDWPQQLDAFLDSFAGGDFRLADEPRGTLRRWIERWVEFRRPALAKSATSAAANTARTQASAGGGYTEGQRDGDLGLPAGRSRRHEPVTASLASQDSVAFATTPPNPDRPDGERATAATDRTGLIRRPIPKHPIIRYIPGRVNIIRLQRPLPFTPEPGAGGILSSHMQFAALPISGAFTKVGPDGQTCRACNSIGFVQITSSRLEIRGTTITSIYWFGQLLNSNRSMHVDGSVPYAGHFIDPTSGHELPFVDQPGGYNGHYWDATTVTLLKQDFEVHVVCLAGPEKGASYGGVMWGHQFTLMKGVGTSINDYSVNRWSQPWDHPSTVFRNLVQPRL